MQFDLTEFLNQLSSSAVMACFTIAGGVIVLVLGQIATKFFIEPLYEQAKLLGEIAHSLTFYANVYGNVDLFPDKEKVKEKVEEASKTLRRQASQLRASVWTIHWYWLWRLLGLVPKKTNVIKASQHLIGLSNSMYRPDHGSIREREKEIKDLLGFK